MAKIDLPKRSGKQSKVREKSVKSQGILKTILSGNPEHIKQDFSPKAWVQPPGVDLGGGAKAKI